MKNISICLIDTDSEFEKTFAKTVSLDYSGYFITVIEFDIANVQPLSHRDISSHDIFLISEKIPLEESFLNSYISRIIFLCDSNDNIKEKANCIFRYAGVEKIILLAKNMVLTNRLVLSPNHVTSKSQFYDIPDESLMLLFSTIGGVGLSSAAIGIGRELSRYRNKKIMYISLEDFENSKLCASKINNHPSLEEFLYRFYRFEKEGRSQPEMEMLVRNSVGIDEYGMYRIKPDNGMNSISTLDVNSLSLILSHLKQALSLDYFILDVGTRITFLTYLMEVYDPLCIYISDDAKNGVNEDIVNHIIGDYVSKKISVALPNCHNDFIKTGDEIEISLSGEFGFAIKGICDKILLNETEATSVKQQ